MIHPLRSTPITEASTLLWGVPPLCPASVLRRLWDHHLRISLHIEATGSHVPHTSLEHGHALFMPDATQPVSRLPIVSGRRTVTEITRPRYHAATASMMLRCRMFSSKTSIATVLRRLWKSQAPL